MAKGGRRKNAGSKEGSIRPSINDYWSQEDIKDYFTHLKTRYKESDILTKFIGEQLMGKAVQPIANPEGETFKISGLELRIRK